MIATIGVSKIFVVSATSRRRDNEITLCLSAPVQKRLT